MGGWGAVNVPHSRGWRLIHYGCRLLAGPRGVAGLGPACLGCLAGRPLEDGRIQALLCSACCACCRMRPCFTTSQVRNPGRVDVRGRVGMGRAGCVRAGGQAGRCDQSLRPVCLAAGAASASVVRMQKVGCCSLMPLSGHPPLTSHHPQPQPRHRCARHVSSAHPPFTAHRP